MAYDEPDAPELNENMAMCVVVDNIPVVDEKKYDKLVGFLKKIFTEFGTIVPNGLSVPTDPDSKMTFGYGFVEYETAEMAANAVKLGDGKKLDNKHKLRVNVWDDFAKYEQVKEKYEAPEQSDYQSRATLNSWMLDGRDQFVVRYGTETNVFWNDPFKEQGQDGRVLKYGGEREKQNGLQWTAGYVAWSGSGVYLATFHEPGLALWGGDDFKQVVKFAHRDVKRISFSPNEKYIITSNDRDRQHEHDYCCYQVWDIRSGKLLRGFDRAKPPGGGAPTWPTFKWSHDDAYLARVTEGVISVYSVPSMGLLDKKSFKVPGVMEIQWSPHQNVLSYWIPEKDNIPAKVALLEIPSRKVIREKHLYNVADIKMHWQEAGDYLCVKLARKKTKKTIVHNFEIFRLRQKDIPIEVLEIEDNIVAFQWEPVGSRFAIIHGIPQKPSVSLYDLKATKLNLIKTLTDRAASHLYWSPTGDYLVIAGLGEKNGALEFLNTNNLDNTVETEHIMCTDVEWDPSGRYVITSVTQSFEKEHWRASMENGYKVWSATGQQLATVPIDSCYQVLWRPRPKPLFTIEQRAAIASNLKDKYWKRFESEDDEIRQSQLSGAAKERANWKIEWKQFRAESDRIYSEEAPERIDLRGGYVSDDDNNYTEIEKITEEEISSETIER